MVLAVAALYERRTAVIDRRYNGPRYAAKLLMTDR